MCRLVIQYIPKAMRRPGDAVSRSDPPAEDPAEAAPRRKRARRIYDNDAQAAQAGVSLALCSETAASRYRP